MTMSCGSPNRNWGLPGWATGGLGSRYSGPRTTRKGRSTQNAPPTRYSKIKPGRRGIRHEKKRVWLTEFPLLAPRWKYHLSNWPLSRGRLITRLVWFLFFSVSQFLLQVLSRTFTPPPIFLESAWFFSHPDPGFCRFHSGFTTQFWFMEQCAQCWWVSNLFTNPWCGPFHIKRQGISRFARFASVFLFFTYFVWF